MITINLTETSNFIITRIILPGAALIGFDIMFGTHISGLETGVEKFAFHIFILNILSEYLIYLSTEVAGNCEIAKHIAREQIEDEKDS